VTTSPHEAPAAWAKLPSARVTTHTLLDAYARSDAWPQTCAWLRNLA
jgi:hypothetical protein